MENDAQLTGLFIRMIAPWALLALGIILPIIFLSRIARNTRKRDRDEK